MTNEQRSELNKFLEDVVGELEIPAYILDNLQKSYEALGDLLNAEVDDMLKGRKVSVYYQGSLVLGTAIRPQNEEDDVDVDMICEVHPIVGWTQKQLKNAVGDRLKSNAIYKRLLEPEGTRCWKLKYRKGSENTADRYHVDILPATASNAQTLEERIKAFDATNPDWQELLLSITDNKRYDYATSRFIWEWLKSNPRAYRLWFEMQCQRGSMILKEFRASVEPFPKSMSKTVLQKAVMLLKRHRDIKYGGNENKPISCIITTLAALAYLGEQDLASALEGIASRMQQFIKFDGINYRIDNPVNPDENFADKWAIYPNRKKIFFEWLSEIEREFGRGELLNESFIKRSEGFKNVFGATLVTKVVNKADNEMRTLQDSGRGGVIKKTGTLVSTLGSGTTLSAGNNFFGADED